MKFALGKLDAIAKIVVNFKQNKLKSKNNINKLKHAKTLSNQAKMNK